jgi:hypothetical protein
MEVKRHKGWKTKLKNTPSGIPISHGFANQWIKNKQASGDKSKYRVVRLTTTKEIMK